MNRVGPTNSICDVPGIRIGHADDTAMATGVTVVLPDKPCVAAVDHRGGGIGARDTVLLNAGSGVPVVHAITLSGGSAYGLDATGGVMHGLRQDGTGVLLRAWGRRRVVCRKVPVHRRVVVVVVEHWRLLRHRDHGAGMLR